MHLKRLTLHGFKTFADKTEIEFVPGVTVIVGPNGSGKSNLLDALVWCLGEQKASALRASRVQDVIFAGSSRRKPMGMAEVSLTVENEDRFLPLDYSEVTVTRRVFRDGESEYFLNKTPCRLRDITDLFLDTGVGRGAYALVNQSEIDAILSARPEDRRELFEEAAGIKKYRVKKREAQRKLENTEANLLRVRDIASELERQLPPLAAQAETARRYRALVERLRAVEVGQLAADYRRLQEEYDELASAEGRGTREADRLQREAQDLEAAEAGLGERIAQAEAGMEEARLRQQAALTRAERLESRLALAEERIGAAERALETLAADRESLEAERLQQALDAEACAQETQRLEALLEERVRERAEVEAALREAEGALAELAQAAAGQEADYLELTRRLAQQRAELHALRERIARRAAEQAQTEDRAKERSVEAAALREESERLAEETARRRARLETVRREIAQEREPLAQRAAAAVQRLGDERLARERELAARESRLRALEETEATQEGYFAGVRAVLNAVAEGSLTGRFQLVADALRVPAEYETAIEVALGASLQDLIAGTEEQAKSAIRWLNERRAGRATFLPLDALREQPVPETLRGARRLAGVRGPAVDLVRFEPEVAAALHVLLSRVLVVEDLDAATQAAKKLERDWARIVTLSGEVVVPTGAITGGRMGRPAPNLLSRKREIAELTEAVHSERAALERLADDLMAAREEETEARQAVRDAEAEATAAREGLTDTERRAQARRVDADRLAGEAEQLRLRAQELADATETDAARERALAASVTESDVRDEGAQMTREEIGRRQARLTLRQQEAREVAARLSADVASLRERVSAGRRDTERAREAALRATLAVEERLRRAAEAALVIEAEQAEALLRAAERDEARRALDDAAGQLERGRERRQALVAENFQLSERIRLARRGIETAREQVQQARLRAARVEAQREMAGQRLLEEYDLHPESALELTGGIPPDTDTAREIARLRREIKALGEVNTGAVEEYERIAERFEFLSVQRADLEEARDRLLEGIAEIDEATRGVFLETFHQVGVEFSRLFVRLFGGGSTELVLTDPDDVLETGIEILAQPPGKRRQSLALLSGGERALTATALLFAFLAVRPAPFCILDEVDAPLDGANVEKFTDLLRDFGRSSQFVVITHNATTMEAASLWYGVTMQEPGVSRSLSMRVPAPDEPAPAASAGGER